MCSQSHIVVMYSMLAHIHYTVCNVVYCHVVTCNKYIQVVYFKAVKKGWAKRFHYGDTLLYAMSTAFVFHVVCASHSLPLCNAQQIKFICMPGK